MIEQIGRRTIDIALTVNRVFTLLLEVLLLSVRPGTWRRTVRRALMIEIWRFGVGAVWFAVTLAVLAGVSLSLQLKSFLVSVGQAGVFASMLTFLIIREAGPLLTALFVVARSAGAMTAELANQKVLGEINVLDAQGVDPLEYIVAPRVLGLGLSLLGLGIVFVFTLVGSAYIFEVLLNPDPLAGGEFLQDVLDQVTAPMVVSIVGKTLIPGLVTGVICCLEGLGAQRTFTDVPHVAARAMTRSIVALFLISAAISGITYL